MSIELKLKAKENYLEAEFIGSRDADNELEESIQIWSKIPLACEEHSLDKILAISRLNRRLKLDNTFVFAEQFNAIGWKPHYKLAGVAFDEELFRDYQLLATFIRNFGYECKMFNTIKDAKNWLMKS
jgi:hypothetical protein